MTVGNMTITAIRSSVGETEKTKSLRGRIALGLVLISLFAWFALTAVILVNAKIATSREIEASFLIADRFAHERATAIENDANPQQALSELYRQLLQIRHVTAEMTFSDGSPVPIAADSTPIEQEAGALEEEGKAPELFAEFIRSAKFQTEFSVVADDRQIATIVLRSNSDDEIDEVWEDFRFILPMTMVYGLAVSVFALLMVSTVFSRLQETSTALSKLRSGESGVRLPESGFAEFEPVGAGFNELAASLMAERRANSQLANRLLTAHDEERRRLASDLHDEVGPSLFLARANLSRLKRVFCDHGPDNSEVLQAPLDELECSINDVQLLMRQILSRMKPMMIGDAPLSAVIETLALDYRRVQPHPEIGLTIGTGDLTFGETIDLTIYRFVSEGILNALRHGGADRIDIDVALAPSTAKEASNLVVTIEDNGSGTPKENARGIGLDGVRERVNTLSGRLIGPERSTRGTRVAIDIPGVEGRKARMPRPE
ncbi:histidine kinase [Fulvimarina sp. MAC8]|uniref:sensor histidine kinase n=1 Tax=Fulvimarina sp. MAC8 TaxID=3162874 RepID=UPI0032EC80A0